MNIPFPDQNQRLFIVEGTEFMAEVQRPADYPDCLNVTIGGIGSSGINVYLDDWKGFLSLIHEVDTWIQSQ